MSPATKPDQRRLTMQLHKLVGQMDRLAEQTLAKSANLTFVQFRLMRVLHRRGTQSQRAVAHLHGVTDAAISRRLDSLVQEKLIHRAINPANRRERLLTLTPKGARLVKQADGQLGTMLETIFSALTPTEQHQLGHFFLRLQQRIWQHGDRVHCGTKKPE